MGCEIIDGSRIAGKILAEAKRQVEGFSPKPCLAILLVGDNPASVLYTNKKIEDCAKVGILSRVARLPASSSKDRILGELKKLNEDGSVDAILVQLPLPASIDEEEILGAISPEKDVDGFHPQNFGQAALGIGQLLPCTPAGVVRLLKESGISLAGKHAVVVGRSRIVGKPLAFLLLNESCTVTICHSKTRDLPSHTKRADIICVAVGKPKTLTADMVKKGAVVVDIGINREGEKLVGDVDFGPVSKKASLITPVPGGVGPMTRAMLIQNTIKCYLMRRR
ncbi:MAG: bifunctional 5,10-methylenetetrahydrofolate dehydrogenase/5,10-methenyltetrahydrofolate cyclohydrolase [Candidatus Micrarchaeota archaeon]|nr:bifunctional 5,10-methylenetetrahydrofolate dehydrogenase/5,10-methenyltetrahydrofolate cyclohydrolase [Candidatus Micrarchaeota archaeon]